MSTQRLPPRLSDLGTGASENAIAAAGLSAKAKLIAADNALHAGIKAGAEALGIDTTTDLTPELKSEALIDLVTGIGAVGTAAKLTAIKAVITASLGAMTNDYYDSVKVGLSQLLELDVDGSGEPVILNLGFLADTDKKIIGNEMATTVTNYFEPRVRRRVVL